MQAHHSQPSLPEAFQGAGETTWATDSPHIHHPTSSSITILHQVERVLLTLHGQVNTAVQASTAAAAEQGSLDPEEGAGDAQQLWRERAPPARASVPGCYIGLQHQCPFGLLSISGCPSSKRHPHPSVPKQWVSDVTVNLCCLKECRKQAFRNCAWNGGRDCHQYHAGFPHTSTARCDKSQPCFVVPAQESNIGPYAMNSLHFP